MTGFDGLLEKYGQVEQEVLVETHDEMPSDELEQRHDRLVQLLNSNYRFVRPTIINAGRYTGQGYGLEVRDHKWCAINQETFQEMHDLFWSEVGDLFMMRHGHELGSIDPLENYVPEEMWSRFENHGSSLNNASEAGR
ncbi:MAG: hypothetical protein CL942_05760 [Desulfovibrio sp.]|nr:hypothetical protein [Desulfovibrio sp.]|tara:strand:+ start:32898 stop:33311 length:414 start_codon:yes stop_codon:yes gene_type:complete